jgi:glycosyltransferase involved in cell wall biosynthesis
MFVVGIDASNLRRGGGQTHLIELLSAACPQRNNFKKIVIWGSQSTLDLLEDRDWLVKRSVSLLQYGLLKRTFWQAARLGQEAQSEGCDILFVPGGSFMTTFRPLVTMSRNLLPFEIDELRRFGLSIMTFKLLILRFVQTRSFEQASGVIFLSKYAQNVVSSITRSILGDSLVVPHGVDKKFLQRPKPQRRISQCSAENPFNLIYVSTVDFYKHQWNVVHAVGSIRKKHGWPITLTLIGAMNKSVKARFDSSIDMHDPKREWVQYLGSIPFNELPNYYQSADLGVFASSCENMPNVLLEKMASGLPIVSSSFGPMPEVLGDNGVYFNPEDALDLRRRIEDLVLNADLRAVLSLKNYERAKTFSWGLCADQTFKFISSLVR